MRPERSIPNQLHLFFNFIINYFGFKNISKIYTIICKFTFVNYNLAC